MEVLIPLEEAREIVLNSVKPMDTVVEFVLDATDRVSVKDLISDSDIAPFNHSSMDGFAVHAEALANASEECPVHLKVITEIAAGDYYDGEVALDECVRIMTGAPLPACLDSIVKYEVVKNGDARAEEVAIFVEPTETGSNVRFAGEEVCAGEVIVRAGEIINPAGVGFLASCGIVEIETYRRPRVAIIATGSELLNPQDKLTPGKIRNSNSYALAASARAAGAIPEIRPIVEDDFDSLTNAVIECTKSFDFVVTSGGAANGDYDFIKQVVASAGDLRMTHVNMRPGKAQTFGLVNDVPVFGLPGNPAAAYLGFEMLIRPALRKMQGYHTFDRPSVMARITHDCNKKDPRRIFNRSTLTKNKEGEYEVTMAKNQSSGLFGPIQRANCFAIMPEGVTPCTKGDMLECILLDVSEDMLI